MSNRTLKVLIKDVKATTKRKDLVSFFSKAIKGPWYKGFASKGDIISCDLISIKDLENGHISHHGLAEITPCKLAWEVVSQLNGKEFLGQTVMVRKWHERTGMGDRRVPLPVERVMGHERRKNHNDRRGNKEIRSETSLSVRGVKEFARSYS